MQTEPSNHRPEGVRYPIEFLFAEHDRQRVVCAALERLAQDCAAEDAQENAAFVLSYLEHELPLHVADEEDDLFPLLKRRSNPDDDVDTILALLTEEHEGDQEYHHKLLEPLCSIAAGLQPSDVVDFTHAARTYSVIQRRHLAWENGTVLPLARKRLTAAD